MSRKRAIPPIPDHIHQGDAEVRNSRTRMRRTKRLRQAVTADVVADEMIGPLGRAKDIAELNAAAEAGARVLGPEKPR